MFRPKVGIGMWSVSAETNGSDYVESESEGGLLIPVGIGVLIAVAESGFIGGDFRYAISPDASDASALSLGLGAGAAF